MQRDKVSIQDLIDTTDRTRVKLSKIGAALLQHIQKYDDIHITTTQTGDKRTPQRSDL